MNSQIRYAEEAPKLGTTFKLLFFPEDSIEGARVCQEVWVLVDRLNMVFSDYETDSEVNQLSLSAGTYTWIPVSDELWEVLQIADRLSQHSDGAFDVTIGPLSKAWRRAFRRNIMPDEDAIHTAQKLVNYKWIQYQEADQSVLLQESKMRIDLGGIAKGYIVDKVYEHLKSKGFENAIVDGGGDLYIGGMPDNGRSWSVAIDKNGLLQEEYENIGIAGSGDEFRFLEYNGERYSHIIDPRSGYGLGQPVSVVVRAPNCTLADALASAISVVGTENAEKLLEYYPECKLLSLEKL